MPSKLLLSRLAYECIKDSITLPNSDFLYDAYVADTYDHNSDFQLQITQVFSAINLALSRLYDSNKLPYFNLEFDVKDTNTNPYIELDSDDEEDESEKKIDSNIEVCNVYQFTTNSNYRNFSFRLQGTSRVYLLNFNGYGNKVFVEYKKEFPQFSDSDVRESVLTGEDVKYVDSNIDLAKEYGITSAMFNYIKEFVKGQIQEIVDPGLANEHNSRAESYFQSLEKKSPNFNQQKIQGKGYGIFF